MATNPLQVGRGGGAHAAVLGAALLALALAPAAEAQVGARPPARQVALEEALPIDDKVPVPVPEPTPGNSFRKPQFVRGDANVDGFVDISDPLTILFHLFLGDDLGCRAAADSNSDLAVDPSDSIALLEFLFLAQAAPGAPGPYTCGVDPASDWLACESFDLCPDDFPLIAHVLDRITFGPTEDLYSRIQTRDDLIRYIDLQLDAPQDYDPQVDEPQVHQAVEALQIGFNDYDTANNQSPRLKAMLIQNALRSEWQLLHVVAQFWNNHFHTQIGSLQQNFFGRNQRGGGAARATVAMFELADTDSSGTLTETEWEAFRAVHPSAIPFLIFGRSARDGEITQQEFLDRGQVGYWKYARGREQFGIAAEIEKREYDHLRRGALGKFRDLLESSAKSVAMIIYLNTYENTVLSPNENFGREFFELLSLDVDKNYTQRDIEEVSKIFTGWTADWVARSAFAAGDTNFQENPGTASFPINLREPRPLAFPTTENWEDDLYTWAFVFGHRRNNRLPDGGHDWGRKDIFLRRYGGVDSLGNPLAADAAIQIPENTSNRTVAAALGEFDLVLDRVVSLRDCAKFISTKLIQLLVTDDLAQLEKNRDMPAELQQAFDAVDGNGNQRIDRAEWGEPIPLVLPDGRPPEIFDNLDADRDDEISELEYREPDLLLDAIDTWRETDGEIREVLRTILHSDEFLGLKFYRAKVKNPFEVVTSTVRVLDGTFTENQLLATTNDLAFSGMELFDFADPTGESEFGFDWMHTVGLLERLKFINRGANPATTGEQRFVWAAGDFRRRWGLTTAERTVDFLTLLIHGGDILENHRALALESYTEAPANLILRIQNTAAFLLSLPQHQKQ